MIRVTPAGLGMAYSTSERRPWLEIRTVVAGIFT